MTSDNAAQGRMAYIRGVDWSQFGYIKFWVYHPGWTNETGSIMLWTDVDNWSLWTFNFAASWIEIIIDLNSTPDDSSGTLDLSDIAWITVYETNVESPGEDYYFDFFRGRSIDVTENITFLKIIEEMGAPSLAEMKIKGESLDHFQAGLEMEVYDADEVLSWTGRILYPESVMEGTEVVGEINAIGSDSNFNNTHRKNFTTARDSDYIIKNIIDNALTKYHSYDDEIDNFTITYKYDLKTKISKMFKYLAMLERAIIHYKPDGEIFFNKYDNLSKGPQIYQGTYNFEDEVVGTTGLDIEFINNLYIVAPVGYAKIVASLDGHKKILEINDNSAAGTTNIRHYFATQTGTGKTVEFWHRTEDNTKVFNFRITDNVATIVCIVDLNGVAGVGDDTWYHWKFIFDIDADTYDYYKDGVLVAADVAFDNVVVNINYLTLITAWGAQNCSHYIDAIGFSWDANYDVGDNLKCWDETTSKIKITSYTPNANRHITRTPVIGANNDLGQVYYVGKASDAAVQKYGFNYLQTWRDSEITNYTEAKQIGDNLQIIYSIDTQMIAMLVVGKGHLQVGKTLNMGWAGVFSITQHDFLLTKRIWYPMNDISELELTDNILTRKAFNVRVINKFYDEDAQQSFEEPDVSESTEDGTVLPLHSIAELRAMDFSEVIVTLPTWPTTVGTAMTIDGAWHDVDISATYGAKEHLVFLYLYTADNAAGQNVALRPKGSESVYTLYTHQTADIGQQKTVAVHTDSDGVFQYKALAGLTNAYYSILAVITP